MGFEMRMSVLLIEFIDHYLSNARLGEDQRELLTRAKELIQQQSETGDVEILKSQLREIRQGAPKIDIKQTKLVLDYISFVLENPPHPATVEALFHRLCEFFTGRTGVSILGEDFETQLGSLRQATRRNRPYAWNLFRRKTGAAYGFFAQVISVFEDMQRSLTIKELHLPELSINPECFKPELLINLEHFKFELGPLHGLRGPISQRLEGILEELTPQEPELPPSSLVPIMQRGLENIRSVILRFFTEFRFLEDLEGEGSVERQVTISERLRNVVPSFVEEGFRLALSGILEAEQNIIPEEERRVIDQRIAGVFAEEGRLDPDGPFIANIFTALESTLLQIGTDLWSRRRHFSFFLNQNPNHLFHRFFENDKFVVHLGTCIMQTIIKVSLIHDEHYTDPLLLRLIQNKLRTMINARVKSQNFLMPESLPIPELSSTLENSSKLLKPLESLRMTIDWSSKLNEGSILREDIWKVSQLPEPRLSPEMRRFWEGFRFFSDQTFHMRPGFGGWFNQRAGNTRRKTL